MDGLIERRPAADCVELCPLCSRMCLDSTNLFLSTCGQLNAEQVMVRSLPRPNIGQPVL